MRPLQPRSVTLSSASAARASPYLDAPGHSSIKSAWSSFQQTKRARPAQSSFQPPQANTPKAQAVEKKPRPAPIASGALVPSRQQLFFQKIGSRPSPQLADRLTLASFRQLFEQFAFRTSQPEGTKQATIDPSVIVFWMQTLTQWTRWRQLFYGFDARAFASRFLVILYAWTQTKFAKQLFVDKPGEHASVERHVIHPFVTIVRGAHGVGKSSIVYFLLDSVLGPHKWHEYDDSYTFRPCISYRIRDILSIKLDDPESLSFHVIENAEVVRDHPDDMEPDAWKRLLDAYAVQVASGSFAAHRIIIITESFEPKWIRVLRDECRANVLELGHSLRELTPKAVPYASYLPLFEGIIGRAKLYHSFESTPIVLVESAMAGQVRAVAACTDGVFVELQAKMQREWRERVQTIEGVESGKLAVQFDCIVRTPVEAVREAQVDKQNISTFSIISSVLHDKTDLAWWDWCDTNLVSDRRALMQLQWVLVTKSRAHGALLRTLVLLDQGFFGQREIGLAALGIRVMLKQVDGQFARLESYDRDISTAVQRQIREAQRQRKQNDWIDAVVKKKARAKYDLFVNSLSVTRRQ